ncbi:aldose 1-epimerase family protein [Allosalinactinospora lopnorensis]|uniref:aldose 1-epimerase family protein n=1 Tax=Allosalinactinospora lopnorensis TaxID=1352348 RepID=UPI000623C3C6|nr:aldose 1-epimerase family protein [Allosalinactinospora lopnorensis]
MDHAIELEAGDYRAVIDLRGAALCRFTWHDEELIWGHSPGGEIRGFQGQLLLPWPNRVGGGRYVFDGTEHQLEITEPGGGSALHGLVHSLLWRPTTTAPDQAVLGCTLDGAPGYPFRLEVTADYRLDPAAGLTTTVTARNTGTSSAPCGIGAHPYLKVDTPLDDATLHLPAQLRQPADEHLLPVDSPEPVAGTAHDFRTPRPVRTATFDTAFTDLRYGPDDRAWTVLSGAETAVGLWNDRSCGWLQIYSADRLVSPDHRAPLAVEPMTCPPNAFATGDALRVLSPGAGMRARFGIRRLPPVTA